MSTKLWMKENFLQTKASDGVPFQISPCFLGKFNNKKKVLRRDHVRDDFQQNWSWILFTDDPFQRKWRGDTGEILKKPKDYNPLH